MKQTISLAYMSHIASVEDFGKILAKTFRPGQLCDIRITSNADDRIYELKNVRVVSSLDLADLIMTNHIREHLIPENFGAECNGLNDKAWDTCIAEAMTKVQYTIAVTPVII